MLLLIFLLDSLIVPETLQALADLFGFECTSKVLQEKGFREFSLPNVLLLLYLPSFLSPYTSIAHGEPHHLTGIKTPGSKRI